MDAGVIAKVQRESGKQEKLEEQEEEEEEDEGDVKKVCQCKQSCVMVYQED